MITIFTKNKLFTMEESWKLYRKIESTNFSYYFSDKGRVKLVTPISEDILELGKGLYIENSELPNLKVVGICDNIYRIIWRLFKCRTYGDYNKLDTKELLNQEELQGLINDIENNSFECKVYLKGLIDELKEVSKHVLINTNGDLYINEYLIGNLLKDNSVDLEEKCKCYYADNYKSDILVKWRK